MVNSDRVADASRFSLRWNNYHNTISTGFHDLLEQEDLVDVTIACEGQFIQAHKIVLSVCSPYFKALFKVNPCQHPIVILKDMRHEDLMALVRFMYLGEVQVRQDELSGFLKTAETLQVKGLSDDGSSSKNTSVPPPPVEVPIQSSAAKHTDNDFQRSRHSTPSSDTRSPAEAPPAKRFRTDSPKARSSTLSSSAPPDTAKSSVESILSDGGFDGSREPKTEPVEEVILDEEYDTHHSYATEKDETELEGTSSDPEKSTGLIMETADILPQLPPHMELSTGDEISIMPVKSSPSTSGTQGLHHGIVYEGGAVMSQMEGSEMQVFPSTSGAGQQDMSNMPPMTARRGQPSTLYPRFYHQQSAALAQVSPPGHYTCPYCRRAFLHKRNISTHIKDHHSGLEQHWPCNLCNRHFRNKSSLRVHKNRYHAEMRHRHSL